MNVSPRSICFALLFGGYVLAVSSAAFGQDEPRVVTTRTYTRGGMAHDEPPTYNAPAPVSPARRGGTVAMPASNRQVMSETPPAPVSRNPYARSASFGTPSDRQWNTMPAQRSARYASAEMQGEVIPQGVPMTSGEGVIVNRGQGAVYVDGPAISEGWEGNGSCASCGDGGCGSCDGCGSCGNCDPCGPRYMPCPSFRLENFEFFAGVQGFKNERNAGRDGSFGFHEGFNWSMPMPCTPCGELTLQYGMQGAHSNFAGVTTLPDGRDQLFITAGLYRRVDWGLQAGIVYDYLSENWHNEMELGQVRGEVSWLFPCIHEFGFWFATNARSDTVEGTDRLTETTNTVWETHELYAFFYRRRFESCEGAEGRIWGGFSGESDGLVGADIRVPVNRCWTLEASFNYLIPNSSSDTIIEQETFETNAANFNESWNVGFHLVWTPQGQCGRNPYSRPLFGVADNGTLIPRIQTPNNVVP